MRNLPCVKEKCLKYPVCKQMEEIKCDMLEQFYESNSVDLGTPGIWVMMNAILPKLTRFKYTKSVVIDIKEHYPISYDKVRLKPIQRD